MISNINGDPFAKWTIQIKKKKSNANTQLSSVQSLSHVRLFETPWIAVHQASLSITNFQSLLKLMPTESVMPSSLLILCRPLLLLPLIPPSIRVFSNESTLHEVAKVLEFQLQHQSSQWIPRTDLFLNGLVGSPWSPRYSQESSPTPQFRDVKKLVLKVPAGKSHYNCEKIYLRKDRSNNCNLFLW